VAIENGQSIGRRKKKPIKKPSTICIEHH